jgi:hypothetical protein
MFAFVRSHSLLILLGAALGATACATAGPYGSLDTFGARSRLYDALKTGYAESRRGHEAERMPVADTLVDGAV